MFNAFTGSTMERVPGSNIGKYAGGGGRNVRPPMPAQNPMQGIASITSGFRPPMNPFQNTQSDVSQAVADIYQENNPQWLRKQMSPYANSGVQSSAATESLIAPRLAAANVQARMAQEMIPFEQGLGNRQYGLGYQTAKAGDVLGQASNLFSRQQMQDQYDLDNQLSQFGLLGQLMQMFGGMGQNFLG